MSITRRSLQQRSLVELRGQTRELSVSITGRKSALVDRIYRALRPDPQPQPQPQRPYEGTSPPADLAETVQRLVESSLQEVEQRLRRAALPPRHTRPSPSTSPSRRKAQPRARPAAQMQRPRSTHSTSKTPPRTGWMRYRTPAYTEGPTAPCAGTREAAHRTR